MRAYTRYGLEAKTCRLQDELTGRMNKLRHRASQSAARPASRLDVAGAEYVALWGGGPQPDPFRHLRHLAQSRTADVFIAHWARRV